MLEKEVKRIIKRMPVLETERLLLRKLNIRDTSDVFEYSSNPIVPRFLTWSPHEDEEYTRDYLRFLVKKYRSGEYLDWALALKDGGKVIGTCGFTSVDINNSKVEIGYVLSEKYWRNGYGAEAVRRVVSYVFDTLEMNRIEARVLIGNTPSENLLLKLGFTKEGMGKSELFVKGTFCDVSHFALCRVDYLNSKK